MSRATQGPGGIRTSTTSPPGGSVTVNVGPNDPAVEVTDTTSGKRNVYDVDSGKDTTVPIPHVPGGTWVRIRVGKGLNARMKLVLVIETGPP